MILTDAGLRTLAANAAARALIGEGDGPLLPRLGRRLRAGESALSTLVAAATADRALRTEVERDAMAGGGWIEIAVRPFAGRSGWAVWHIAEATRQHRLADDLASQQARGAELAATLATVEQRFQRFFEELPVGWAIVDAKGRIEECNPAFQALAAPSGSTTTAALRGRALDQLLQAEDAVRASARLAEAWRGVAAKAPDEVRLAGPGERVASLYVGRIDGPDGTPVSLVLHLLDVTGLRSLERQFAQSQKMQAIGQLAGGVAHDFNNMLMVILGNADMMLDELPANSSLRPLCETILHAAEGSAELTARLLAFSRQQPLQPRRMQVNEVVEKTADLLKRTLGENVSIKLDVAADAWDVMVDRAQLEAAIMNLAINGRDAMLNGGALTVETDNAHIDETYVAANPDATVGDFVAVVVSDNGTGMTQDVVQRVFEPFFTTKEVGKGTGLGLSMVYGFVRQTGGHVKIYSEVGYGTSVKMYFPRAAEGTELAEATPEAGSALPSGHEAILVVEDDARVRDHVSGQLKHLGYRITSAKDGPEALNILKGTTFDLLFTDVVMPGGLTGRDLAENAKQLKPSIKVLYTSGYTQDAIVHHGRLDAGVHLLSKPYRLRDLAGKVRAVLDAA